MVATDIPEPGSVDPALVQHLAAQVAALDPQPRPRRWVSLSLCVLDAVWSIGLRYHQVVAPVVTKVASEFGVARPTVPAATALMEDPIPLTVFRDRFATADALRAVTTEHRTSTRGGIYKADAAVRYADILREHHIDTLADARHVLADPDRLAVVDADLRRVPGDGAHAIRRDYLWMLIGDDELIKPDRMVLRWLRHHGADVGPATARRLVTAIAAVLNQDESQPRQITAWEIDHALWQAGQKLPRL
ncbi:MULTISPECIES: hypothetical protein [Rhodococcus]|uniref:hypothetical protein n=1 Tax=Rhodococcus TaxID=1827 RepID=UPI00215579FA|nr:MULTISPECIES: hypothetical protein [Rhodococcus]WKW98889.1 hypothetical protein Q3O43_00675 [Rhodococcus aetherivorans]